jgi:hypothetical protein
MKTQYDRQGVFAAVRHSTTLCEVNTQMSLRQDVLSSQMC